jgi:2-phospho-L-lactate guanylyltransferase (CobY/MobA/RfbA family)
MFMPKDAIVVPIKRFDVAKVRLRQGGVADVTSLARSLAAGVLAASAPRHIVVVSESKDVTHFAEVHGAEVLELPSTGLNGALQGAYEALGPRFEFLILVHGDLRFPEGLGQFAFEPGITIITDHHGEGTNVMALATGLDFHFSYGPGSLDRHVDEAKRLGVEFRVIRDSPWRYDVDEASDLQDP